MAKGSYAVRLYEPELAGACNRFVSRVWPAMDDRDGAGLDTRPTSAPRILFLKEQEVIGHVATIPVRLAVKGELHDASWAVGLIVLPEHRNGPVAPMLTKKLNETIDIGLTLHVEEAALRVFKGVGWRHLGVIPQYIRVLNAPAFVRTFAGCAESFVHGRGARLWCLLGRSWFPLAGLVRVVFMGLAFAGALRRRRATGAHVVEEARFDASYTELAERVKDKLDVWVYRDAQYLTQRYGTRMGAYRLLACRAAGRLLGYVVLKLRQFRADPRMGQIRMGTIVDCVFDPDEPAVLDTLLHAAVVRCQREGADVVFCSTSLRTMRERLFRHAFLSMRGTLNVAFHDRTATLGDNLPLDAWHLMRGDSDADANC
jgi:hypothetical protein